MQQLRRLTQPRTMVQMHPILGLSNSKYSWAHRICINQDRVQERSSQVGLMGSIYGGPSIVFACLGDEGQDALLAVEAALKLRELMHASMPGKVLHKRFFQGNASQIWARMDTEPPTKRHWSAWFSFFSRPWFRRTWILQEMLLPSVERVLGVCGRETVMMSAF